MIQTRLFSAALLLAGLAQASAALAAAPQVIINQGQSNNCTVTPASGTVFTLDSGGNVLVNGTYTAGPCSTGGTGGGNGNPTFSFAPNPADLTIPGNSLPSTGGTVTPNFVAYFANTCTGKVTPSANCTAPTGAWGTGGTVCTGTTNAGGQTYCSPSGTVTLPANTSTSTACTYTFQAINCTNGTTSVNSQTATVTVAFNGSVGTGCTAGDTSGDLGPLGYSRQCTGSIHSQNINLTPTWNNSYSGFMSGAAWGADTAPQYGQGLTITVNAMQYGSFSFTTPATGTGIKIQPNGSYGAAGLASVSTSVGDFFAGTSLCVGSALTMSSKSNTVAGTNCKLQPNTTYYLNISNASYSPPHDTTCGGSSCNTGWTVYLYSN